MGLLPYLCFTRLLRDGSRAALGRYLEDLTTAFATWEGADGGIRFRPGNALRDWCRPLAEGIPWEVGRSVGPRSVFCRIAASDTVREWHITLGFAGAPRITGALFAKDPSERLDEAYDWHGYGDHLITNSVADTASSIRDLYSVQGFESSVYLVSRIEAVFMGSGANKGRISKTSPAKALIRAVEQALSGGLLGREIVTIAADRKKMRKFLARCDTELLETLGAKELSRVLAPLGLTLKQWRKAF